VEEGRAELGPEWYPTEEGRKRADVPSLKTPAAVGGGAPAWITTDTDTYIGYVNRGGDNGSGSGTSGGSGRGGGRRRGAGTAGAALLRRAHAELYAREIRRRALYGRMRSVAAALRLPSSIPAHAHQIYVDAANAGIRFWGIGSDRVAVATTLAALRRLGGPQPHPREVAPLVRSLKATYRLYRKIITALGIGAANTGAEAAGRGGNPHTGSIIAATPAARYLPQMCTALQLTPPQYAEALKALAEASKRGYTSGRSPRALAAAAAYIQAVREQHSEAEATFKAALQASGVAPKTLREAIRILGGKPPNPPQPQPSTTQTNTTRRAATHHTTRCISPEDKQEERR